MGHWPPPIPPQKLWEDVTARVFRAHWMIVPLQVLAVTLVFVALVGPILTSFGFAWVLMMTVAVVFGSLAYALPSWWYGTFGLREDHLVVHTGLVMRSSREIPLSRLQAVDVVQPLLLQVFGMAEGLVNYTRHDDPDDLVVTTQGRPTSDHDEIRIVDDHDHPVPEGEPGHLLTRGPYTIRGYYRAPEHNATAFTADGFYRTGDIVRRHPSGNLVVAGRAKDQINRGGEKIGAEEVENHILAHPGVHDASVVAVPDPYLGERTYAHVIPKGQAPTRVELQAFLRERGLAAYKIPDRVSFVDTFPATAVGKTSKRDLRGTTDPSGEH